MIAFILFFRFVYGGCVCVVIMTFPLWSLNKCLFICSIILLQCEQIGNSRMVSGLSNQCYYKWENKTLTELLANRRWNVLSYVCCECGHLCVWNVYQVQCSMSGHLYVRICVQNTIYAQTKGSMCWSIALFRPVFSSVTFSSSSSFPRFLIKTRKRRRKQTKIN